MIGWFKDLSDGNKIAIVVPVGLALITGLCILATWLFSAEKQLDNPKRKAEAMSYIKPPRTKPRKQLSEPVISIPSLKGIHDPNK